MTVLGSVSGRNEDKISRSGLTPLPSLKVSAPSYEESELILECRTIYRDTMKPECFKDESLEQYYPIKDYHVIYLAEILRASGNSPYRKS